jgi:hypothetical protein
MIIHNALNHDSTSSSTYYSTFSCFSSFGEDFFRPLLVEGAKAVGSAGASGSELLDDFFLCTFSALISVFFFFKPWNSYKSSTANFMNSYLGISSIAFFKILGQALETSLASAISLIFSRTSQRNSSRDLSTRYGTTLDSLPTSWFYWMIFLILLWS